MINLIKHKHQTDLIIDFKMPIKIFAYPYSLLKQYYQNKKTFFFCLMLALGFGFGTAIFNNPFNFHKAQNLEKIVLAKISKEKNYLAESTPSQDLNSDLIQF